MFWIFCLPPSVVQGNSGIPLSSVLRLFQSFGQLKLDQIKKQRDKVSSIKQSQLTGKCYSPSALNVQNMKLS